MDDQRQDRPRRGSGHVARAPLVRLSPRRAQRRESMSAAEANRPLDGLVVIDLSQIYNGPYATFLLATGGATVIKIEPPGGEPLRRRGAVGGAALPFAMLNGCKKSVVLDLKSEAGKAALLALVKDADVLVENFAPGTMERLGLGAEMLQT